MDAGRSVPTAGGLGRHALGDAVLPQTGTEGTARVTYGERTEWTRLVTWSAQQHERQENLVHIANSG